jgi:hypothetical protein
MRSGQPIVHGGQRFSESSSAVHRTKEVVLPAGSARKQPVPSGPLMEDAYAEDTAAGRVHSRAQDLFREMFR